MEKKVALITGAGTGIGKACAVSFVEGGYHVAIAGRNMDKLETVCAELNSQDVSCYELDVSKQADVNLVIHDIVQRFGRLDVLVNNAGICTNIPFLEMTLEQYDEVIKINQYGTFFCMQAAARKMAELGNKGVIVNVSSIFYDVASLGIMHYHASKGAITTMTKSAALELAPHNIRVVGVAPGIVDTPMLDIDKQKGTWDSLQKKHMREKALQPAEIADVILFLCSEKANGINGNTIPIEDGLFSKY